MNWTFCRHIVSALIAIVLVVSTCNAQTGTSSLRGTVLDKSGGVIVGAQVILSDPQQGFERTTTSGSQGEYEFLALRPGTYLLAVVKDGFQKYTQSNVQLLVNLPATQTITMEIGSSTQTVEVSATTETLNTTDATIGIAFNENQVKQLPLEGRNVPDLLSLQPGVAYTGNRADVPAFDTRNGAVNGARSDQSNVTLDGISVNDDGGNAFTSVLPVTLDSVQEFRVTTTNANADQGSSGGAQVALVTKSGTNDFHGSVYEYHRNTYTSANDYFVKQSELQSGQPNVPPKLIRNIFGGSIGGPIKKDRLFLFLNYEGTRRAEATSQTSPVPSLAFRDGVIQYACATSSQCPGGTATGISGKTYTIAPGNFALAQADLVHIDPLALGANTASVAFLSTFPNPNSANAGDGLNYQGYNFASPVSETKNEYIAKMDYNISRDARHRLFVSGALRNDANPQAPFLPGQAPLNSVVNYNKGIIVGYSGVFSANLVNNVRYGFIRESAGTIGNSNDTWVLFRGLNDPVAGAITRSRSFQRPTHIINDDLSWIRGRHTWQFGGQLAFIRNPRQSLNGVYSSGVANPGWLDTTGFAGKQNSPLDPPNSINPATGVAYPKVDPNFSNSYDFPLTALLGMVPEVNAVYNYQRDGNPAPQNQPLKRHFAINSYEMYVQDSWKAKPNLTITLGLRYSLFSPPWETNGLEVSPTFNLGHWFDNRAHEGANGIPSNQDPLVAFDWSGPANGKSGFYNWDYKNLGPRVAFAWAPDRTRGLLGSALGSHQTSIRGGFGIVYDRFGQQLVDDFDQFGSFGLSTSLTNTAESLTVSTAPRLSDVHTIPTQDRNGNTIFLPAPPATFPQPFPTGTFQATTGLDSGMKTPYALTFDLSVSRELRNGFSLDVSYVGRLSRRLLVQQDLAMPLNFKDKKSGLDYFTAVTALAKVYRTGESSLNFSPSQVSPQVSQYWANVLQPLQSGGMYQISSCTGRDNQGNPIVTGTTSPVVAAYDWFCSSSFNETTPLQFLDQGGIPDFTNNPNCGQQGFPACQSYFGIGGPFTFFTPQYSALYAFRTAGTASYHALQVTLHHKMSHGVQFDFNYTYSKSIDLASDAERVGTFGGTGAAIVNSWSPTQLRGVSDFDATHQFNANWIADLPFGRGRAFGRNSSRVVDALVGGWQFSGLFRETTGFPLSFFNGFNFPTNWDLGGNAVQIASAGATGSYKNPTNGTVSVFKAGGSAAASFFREPFPGESGQRNNFRGDGFFGLDFGLSKRWAMPWKESQSLQFRWEVFNVLNATRFDTQSVNASIDTFGDSFGNYTRLSTNPRVMQFALRFEF